MSESIETVIENDDSISIKPFLDKLTNNNIVTISPLENIYELHNTALRNNENKTCKCSKDKHVLLVLNQRINLKDKFFSKLWDSTSIRICADGGLNRLNNFDKNDKYIPDYVIGDLDSATEKNLSHYVSKGTKKILQDSQYYTDFIKSISLINLIYNSPDAFNSIDFNNEENLTDTLEILESQKFNKDEKYNPINITVLGGVGGRFDQTMATINQIWKYSVERPHINFTIINPEHAEFIFLLNSGTNFVSYPRKSDNQEIEIFGFVTEKSRPDLRNVGILPLLYDCKINTYGLKWDVSNYSTALKTKMSSSNLQVGQEGFIISTDHALFVTLEI